MFIKTERKFGWQIDSYKLNFGDCDLIFGFAFNQNIFEALEFLYIVIKDLKKMNATYW